MVPRRRKDSALPRTSLCSASTLINDFISRHPPSSLTSDPSIWLPLELSDQPARLSNIRAATSSQNAPTRVFNETMGYSLCAQGCCCAVLVDQKGKPGNADLGIRNISIQFRCSGTWPAVQHVSLQKPPTTKCLHPQESHTDENEHRSQAALAPAKRACNTQFPRHLYTEEQIVTMWSSRGADFEWVTKDVRIWCSTWTTPF